jgi:DNA-binding MarR family transcriptional regulator
MDAQDEPDVDNETRECDQQASPTPGSGNEKTEPLPDSLANSVGFLLNRAAKIIHDMNEQALKPLRLSPRELGLLRIIAEEGPLSQQAIGQKHSIDRTTIVGILDQLEKRDLVTRISNQADRRVNLLYITPRGKKTVAQAVRLVERQQERFLAPLNADEWKSLKQSLVALITHHMG